MSEPSFLALRIATRENSSPRGSRITVRITRRINSPYNSSAGTPWSSDFRAILNAQPTPAPHLFVFDADGRFRYAGDPHNHWGKPDQEKDDFFSRALDLVLAGEYEENGAVFYNSKPCDCAEPTCSCPKCRCGSSCRCATKHCGVGF